jgi:DNA excision repair protein ERCC-2
MDDFFKQIHFPYETVRKGQDEFISKVYQTIQQEKNILVSAPTGLGKTVSALAPAIYQAKAREKTVIVLTSRQTQANQVIKTIIDISKASKQEISYVAFIGKRSMCIHEEKELYPAQDFNDFCKKVRETGKCGHYINAKNSEHEALKKEIIKTSVQAGMSVEGFIDLCKVNKPDRKEFPTASKCGFCPYELTGEKAYRADVVICDFNYVFQKGIRENFLGKLGRSIEDCIIVVDEAHNLPDRIRKSHSYTLNTQMVDLALQEIKDFAKSSKLDALFYVLNSTFDTLGKALEHQKVTEKIILKEDFLTLITSQTKKDIEDWIEECKTIEMIVKEEKIVSHVGRIGQFLEKWKTISSQGFLRTGEKVIRGNKVLYQYKITCIDPSEFSSSLLNSSHSSILMSATLSPITMYQQILGIENATCLELDSPFSKQNQLTLVVDDVTSKYTQRTPEMFKKIAKHIKEIVRTVQDKNGIVFFPSYDFMEKILAHISITQLDRKILKEQKFMSKEEKEDIIREFKSHTTFNNKSKLLFAITSGSFAEGVDLPKEMLELVIVVGLPLGVPDLYTKSVINHYDKKFHKGQLYGYVYPAMSKIIQAAGRCIRTEEDRGVVVLMDNRFYFPLYAKAFPKHWHLQKTKHPQLEISNFFDDKDPLSL